MNKFFSLSAAVVAVWSFLVSPSWAGYEDRADLYYWAPGIINPAGGTVEMDVEFMVARSAMRSDWNALFRLPGNRPSNSDTTLGVTVCPAADPRDLAVTARGGQGAAFINAVAPDWPVGKSCRFALAWGDGVVSLWYGGKKLKSEKFMGSLNLLPEKFLMGQGYQTGFPSAYHVKAVRISDQPREDGFLCDSASLPLGQDARTTFLKKADGKQFTGKTNWQAEEFRAGLFPTREKTPLAVPQGSPLKLALCGVNFQDSAAAFTVQYAVKNRVGDTVLGGKEAVKIPPSTIYQPFSILIPPTKQTGFFHAEVTVSASGADPSTYVVNYVVQPDEKLKPGRLSEYLGHHYPIFADVGYQWVRAWGLYKVLHWFQVEPVPGKFEWGAADRFVKESEERGFHILGVLGYPPAWASTYSAEERDRLKIPQGRTYTNSPDRYQPRSIDEWKTYVRAVVERYHDRIKYWEIYNEVDFHPPAMHATFSGSTEDYHALLRSASEVIKKIDPSAKVLTSGFSLSKGITDTQMPLDLLKMGAAPDFDIFNVHGYTDKETVEETARAMRQAKPGVPLWMSEFMFEKPADDFLLVDKCFWFLSQGYSKYFLFGGELDRDFDSLAITPFYAVAAELGRQLRACDEYVGPVERTPGSFSSWQLRRSDGSYLQVFAVNNGRVKLQFAATAEPLHVLITDLYGETLFRGVWDSAREFAFEGIVYVSSNQKMGIVRADREHGNVLANAGFEIREGDYQMDESLARPSSWTLRPPGAPAQSLKFVAGRTGSYAVHLQNLPGKPQPVIGQLIVMDTPGVWSYSAWIKAAPGTKGYLQIKVNQNGEWRPELQQRFTGTGEWQKVSAGLSLPEPAHQAVALVGLETPEGEMQVDDTELLHESGK